MKIIKASVCLLICIFASLALPIVGECTYYPISFKDSSGNTIVITRPPKRVVSLVPYVTEILLMIGAEKSLIGTTYHTPSAWLPKKTVILGGFILPDLPLIKKLGPDVIFCAKRQLRPLTSISWASQGKTSPILINLEPRTIEDAFQIIELIGRIFNLEKQAISIIELQKKDLELIERKVSRISKARRKRVMRIMGRKDIMAPGDDSFQNQFIRAAGGIPPRFGKKGSIVPVTLNDWRRFNPEVVYGCGGDREVLDTLLKRPEWAQVDAVKNNRIYFFPCELTCRASTHMGYFVKWLAASIYIDEFSAPENIVLPQGRLSERAIKIGLSYIEDASIVETRIKDFVNKTLLIRLKHPMKVVSTLEGERDGIEVVGNHYYPPPLWGISHKSGLKRLRDDTLEALGLSPTTTSVLFTGADMDNLAIAEETYKEIQVYALVTAGIRSNAQRMSKDYGPFYEPDARKHKGPGTINILILTNHRLSKRAMTRAIITATEAKSAALADLDIRSSYTPLRHVATGTGTDNIIVVEGDGEVLDSSGGHTRLGELMAKAVYKGVIQAIARQNGIDERRSIFQRLRERHIEILPLAMKCAPRDQEEGFWERVQVLLLDPYHESFVDAMLAISDRTFALKNKSIIKKVTEDIAEAEATRTIGRHTRLSKCDALNQLPSPIREALSAIFTAAYASLEAKKQ
ncbi:Vitamin B12 ABC transporter, B12-binding component BtuF [Dissulfuribacter thermophilus]|uniref:Vitamin B12 ABC transporter, B12-binding component BtuF n=1 Tax=Dissulfuribacter thermophilus TaxID=1156395 RepID=A0A1B9F673_9BACT|nr:adenosylcobinamide amidohydrolase [Dissulfuribacter thermophilus]OCC15334.1 Vitamin B12 ABC transporter, B12-binding component BtuF [Dissulfuribacter thermophilus]